MSRWSITFSSPSGTRSSRSSKSVSPPGQRLRAGRRRGPSRGCRGSGGPACPRRSRYACPDPRTRCRCGRCRESACSLLRLAGILEVEGGDEPPEADELSRDEAELDDFLIREMRAQLGEKAVVELVMVLRHEGGEA